MEKKFLVLSLIIILLVMLIGCQATATSGPDLPVTSAAEEVVDRSDTSSAALLPGIYATSIKAEDYFPLPNYSSTKFETYVAGDWEIKFDEEHHYNVIKNGDFLAATGNCTVTEDRIVCTDETGPWACFGSDERNGTYQWTFDGQTLTLTAVEDRCAGRNYVFTTHPFLRQN